MYILYIYIYIYIYICVLYRKIVKVFGLGITRMQQEG